MPTWDEEALYTTLSTISPSTMTTNAAVRSRKCSILSAVDISAIIYYAIILYLEYKLQSCRFVSFQGQEHASAGTSVSIVITQIQRTHISGIFYFLCVVVRWGRRFHIAVLIVPLDFPCGQSLKSDGITAINQLDPRDFVERSPPHEHIESHPRGREGDDDGSRPDKQQREVDREADNLVGTLKEQ
jgi:hypothetical protein